MQFSPKKSFVITNNFSTTTNYLGFYVDSELTQKQDGEYIANKICKAIYLLRNLADNLPLNTTRLAYFAVVNSHLEYGILVWSHSPSLTRFFKLQRRAIRIICCLDIEMTVGTVLAI